MGSPGAADDWSSVVGGSRRVVGRILADGYDGDGRLEGGISLFVKYGSSRLSIRVVIGALLVAGWLAGVSFCLCSCRRQGAGWQS